MRNTSKLRVRLLAFLFVALGLSFGKANAQCNNPTTGSVPFNCTQGAAPQPGDLVLGGQNSQTVKWTWAQVFNPNGGLLPIATPITPGISRPDGSTITISNGVLTAAGGGGGGSVSSVGLTMPGIFTVTNSPITGAGSIGVALNTVSPNLVFSGPSSGSAATPTFRALTIADMPSGLAVPGGSTWAVQINGGAGAFSGQSLSSGQILIGQASGSPLPQSITGCALSAVGVLTCPASGLTGNTLASGILNSSLTGVGTIGSGTWQGTLINPTYGGTGVNNGSKTITLGGSLITTGAGTPTFAMPSGSFAYGFPGGAGNLSYLPSGVTPVNTDCVVWSGSLGAQGDSGGPCGGTVTFVGGGGSFGAATLNMGGGVVTQPTAGVATYTPQTTDRKVTGSGGNCSSIGVTTAAICASDAGNYVIYNGSGLTSAISQLTSSYLPANQTVTICNQFAGTLSGTSFNQIIGYPSGGSAGAYTFTLPAPQNGVMACVGFLSDGTFLYAGLVSAPPNLVFTNIASQPMTGGFSYTSDNLGTVTSGAINVDCSQRLTQYAANNGATSLTMSNNDNDCYLLVTNGVSAGAIVPSGFTVGNNTGDPIDAVSGHKFKWHLNQINGIQSYTTQALQSPSSNFVFSPSPPAPWTAAQTGTSGAYDTRGAAIEDIAVTYSSFNTPTVTITDSGVNTWTLKHAVYNSGIANLAIYECTGCSVSATQTFTVSCSAACVFNAAVVAFSAPVGYAADGAIVATTSGNAPTVQPGSKTPAGAGDLFVTATLSTDVGSALTIASPFTAAGSIASIAGGYYGLLLGYYIQPGSSAQNPTTTISGGTNLAFAAQWAFAP